jgi:hypothetical protein
MEKIGLKNEGLKIFFRIIYFLENKTLKLPNRLKETLLRENF